MSADGVVAPTGRSSNFLIEDFSFGTELPLAFGKIVIDQLRITPAPTVGCMLIATRNNLRGKITFSPPKSVAFTPASRNSVCYIWFIKN